MDALEILINKDKILPYFQPIISADEQSVVGYEVLGRIEIDNEVKSLGDFFQNDNVPYEYIMEIDEHIQLLAFDYYCKSGSQVDLFFNCNANILMNNHEYSEQFISRIQSFQRFGLKFENIVVELREDNYEGELSQLSHLILYYQSLGIRVAIDNLGKGGSNLDRIAYLEPNIVKVDLSFIKGAIISQAQRDVLYSLSMFSRKIGAILQFEGISDLTKLNAAWKKGGRYFQGFYLAKPDKDFVQQTSFKATLTEQFHQFINHERKKLTNRYNFTNELNNQLELLVKKERKNDYNEIMETVSAALNNLCFRVYICDQYGFQKSANYVKINQSWQTEREYVGKNWSWRPYFLETIVRMQYDKRGILSDLYRDIKTNEFIRTFSYPLNEDLYLFLDIPYAYLFEKDGLLFN